MQPIPIVEYTIIMFLNQLAFIGFRTWNVKAIAKGSVLGALASGAIVHITWLIGIAIGVVSMAEILQNMAWEYTPIVIASTLGGLLGTWIGMREKKHE
jgi:uncharacterized membrane protein